MENPREEGCCNFCDWADGEMRRKLASQKSRVGFFCWFHKMVCCLSREDRTRVCEKEHPMLVHVAFWNGDWRFAISLVGMIVEMMY